MAPPLSSGLRGRAGMVRPNGYETAVATTHADFAIESFSELETRFAEFLRVVPPDPTHLRVYSAVLASIFLDTCSLLESILKSAMDNARYDGITISAAHRASRYAAGTALSQYSRIFELFFGLTPFMQNVSGF